MGVTLGQLGLVAHYDVKVLAVGSGKNRMRSVFASRGGKFLDRHDLVELIVTVGIEQAEHSGSGYTGAGIDHDVKTVEGIAQALSVPDLGKLFLGFRRTSHTGPLGGVGDLLDACGIDVLARCRNGKAVNPSVLITDDQALLVVHAHRDPRSLLFHGHGIEQVDLEAVGNVDAVGRSG